MKNVLVMQSGGPTAAINATAAGVVERALISDKVDKIYASIYGIKGSIFDNIVEIGDVLSSPTEMSKFMHTPSAGLGSARHKLPKLDDDTDEFERIFKTFEQYNIGYVICIGGNDSMDTVHKLSTYAKEHSIKGIEIMGAPKTVDNDLCQMDHSPGFPSAARYVSTTMCELWADCHVYDIPAVTIVEIMGRHTGWLTASSIVASSAGMGPDLIYLPETTFDNNKFLNDVREKLENNPAVIIAVSEGIKYENGKFVGEGLDDGVVDAFGHTQLSGASRVLEALINDNMNVKVRSIEFSLMQRAAAHLSSSVDIIESRMLGSTALDRAISGISGHVSVLNRLSNNPYRVKYSSVPVSEVANLEKHFPTEWITKEGNFITDEGLEYFKPLIALEGEERYKDGLPSYTQFI